MKLYVLKTLAIIALFSTCLDAQSGGQFSITSSVVAGGGGTSSGGTFSIDGTTGQAVAGNIISGSLYDLSSGFWQTQPAQNATSASISGKVRTFGGRGITNAVLTLTAADNSTRVVLSGRLGSYRFDNVSSGSNYTLNVLTRRFRFASPTIIVSVQDDITGLDFVSNSSP